MGPDENAAGRYFVQVDGYSRLTSIRQSNLILNPVEKKKVVTNYFAPNPTRLSV